MKGVTLIRLHRRYMAKQATPKQLKVPREIKAIQEEYGKTCIDAGQKQYEIQLKQKELELINERLKLLNNEAHNRIILDKQAEESKKDENQVRASD